MKMIMGPVLTLALVVTLGPLAEADLIGAKLLGRPTDTSVTVNVLAEEDLEVYIEYGTESDVYTGQSVPTVFPGGEPIEAVIDGLDPDKRYYYRMRYRRPGEPEFSKGEENSFHTQRQPGSIFTFMVQADSHIPIESLKKMKVVYTMTLLNMRADNPDFIIDLGDTFMGAGAGTHEELIKFHLVQRPFFGIVCHSAPLFLVLGNHEGENRRYLDGTPDNIAIWATNARKLYYLNPIPDEFYTGSTSIEEFVTGDGLRENYYAWRWGNALFVVLDPYWYRSPGRMGNWESYSLGYEQYSWFKQTLEQSHAKFKFVFIHQLVGGCSILGRGGVECAEYYEWGGKNRDGSWGFNDKRRGWEMPIHQLMVENGVTILFHGHDHVFVKQDLDGIVYQACPKASDHLYSDGFYTKGGYESGVQVNNSGHLRVAVSESDVTVDYVRAYAQGDGPNGEIAYTYTINNASNSDPAPLLSGDGGGSGG